MGVWIEICPYKYIITVRTVTPCVGVWIEIARELRRKRYKRSLPAWECGLKYEMEETINTPQLVTPCVGVWIEISYHVHCNFVLSVTPCVGVWIEIKA